MSTGHLAVFDRTLRTSTSWLEELELDLDIKDAKRAYVGLRAVLHTLRDRLPLPEVIQLGAQLPQLLRGMFYDGWRPAGKPLKIRRRAQFVDLVEERLGNGHRLDAERVVRAVFRLLSRRVSAGEIDDVIDSLPTSIADLWFEDSPYTVRDD